MNGRRVTAGVAVAAALAVAASRAPCRTPRTIRGLPKGLTAVGLYPAIAGAAGTAGAGGSRTPAVAMPQRAAVALPSWFVHAAGNALRRLAVR